MLQVLRISLVQAVRSIILILLPISFLALITWATAGSSSGNTADPIRGALWFFLAAHQVPLQIAIDNASTSGSLTFLPLGALAIPFFAIRAGYRRTLEIAEAQSLLERRRYLIGFSVFYALIGFLVVTPALGKTVTSPWYFILPIFFTIALTFAFLTGGFQQDRKTSSPFQLALRISCVTTVALIGIGALLLFVSLAWHFETVLNLIRVVEPGIFGGLTLLLVQLLYLPNLAISALSYGVGSGFAISNGTLLSPFIHRIEEIPAIPILGALPTSSTPLIASASLLVIALGVMATPYLKEKRSLVFALILLVLFNLIAARAASGELISNNLSEVGPIWWSMPLLISVEFALGVLAATLVPKIFARSGKSDEL